MSFFALALLPRHPSRILLIGLGAGQLVELWRTHLPRTASSTLEVHCVRFAVTHTLQPTTRPFCPRVKVSLFVLDQVELHAEVVDLARQHFDFGRADDAQTTVTVQVEDGRDFLERSPSSAYDLVMVDLSVAGFVDESACSHLRRVLRPGGVCVHNYNFAGRQEVSDALPATFAQVHQLIINATNTIFVSTTADICDDDFQTLVDKATTVPYASPLLFDLRAVSSCICASIIRQSTAIKHTRALTITSY